MNHIHATPKADLPDSRQVATQNELIYDPPGEMGPIQWAVNAIAARESRDIVKNIQVLDAIAATPAPIRTAL